MAKEISLNIKLKKNQKEKRKQKRGKKWKIFYNDTSSATCNKIHETSATLLGNWNYTYYNKECQLEFIILIWLTFPSSYVHTSSSRNKGGYEFCSPPTRLYEMSWGFLSDFIISVIFFQFYTDKRYENNRNFCKQTSSVNFVLWYSGIAYRH